MKGTTEVFISNAHADGAVYFPNANGVNLPAATPSILDLNRIMSRDGVLATEPEEPIESSEPFGTHIKEAVAIVKDWAGSRKK